MNRDTETNEASIHALRSLSDARPSPAAERRMVARALASMPHGKPARRWILRPLAVAGGLAAVAALFTVLALPGIREAPSPHPQLAATTEPGTGSVRQAVDQPTSFTVGAHSVHIDVHGSLRVEHAEANAIDLRVVQGRAYFEVEPLGPGQSFKVRTEQVLVEVVGTRFSVESRGRCSVVAVEEGRVRVTDHRGNRDHLSAGNQRQFCSDGDAAAELLREALVLVSQGRELERAARLLSRYRADHPGGVLEEEALFHLCLVKARLGETSAALELADEFRQRFPGSDRAERLGHWLDEAAP